MHTRSNFLLPVFSLILVFGLSFSCSKEKPENQSQTEEISRRERQSLGKSDDEMLLADSLLVLAKSLIARSQFDSARTPLEQASAIYQKAAGDSGYQAIYEKFLQTQNDYCDVLRRKGAYDQTLQILNKNIEAALQRLGRMNATVARTYDVLAATHWQKGLHDQALANANEALAIRTQVLPPDHIDYARGYHNLALLHMEKGLLDSSVALYKRALAIRLKILGRYHFDTAITYNNLGLVYQTKGDLENAALNYEQANEITLKLNNLYLAGNIYHNLARIHSDQGDLHKAIEMFRKVISILSPILGASHFEIARAHLNIAREYQSMLDHDNAVPHLRQAITMFRQTVGDKHPFLGIAYNNLGNVHRVEYANYDSALFFYDKALQIALQAGGAVHNDVGQAIHNIGSTHLKMGNSQQAIKYHLQAADIFRKAFGHKSLGLGSTYKGVGDAYLQQQNLNDALSYYQKALIALDYDFDGSAISALPKLDNIVSDGYFSMALDAKAHALVRRAALSREDLPRTEDLKIALSTYDKFLEHAEKTRRNYKADQTKLDQARHVAQVQESAISAAIDLHRLTGEEEYRRKAFRYSETAKALLLLEALQETNAKKFAGIADSLLEQERQMRLTLAYNRTQLQLEKLKTPKDSLKIATWIERCVNEGERYDALLKRFEENYPSYYALKHRAGIATVADVQQALDANSVLVEYFVGDSVIHIFTISRDDFEVTSARKDSLLTQRVESLLAAMTKEKYGEYVQQAHEIFRELIAPVTKHIAGKSLLIIPDGVLSYLPFEALLTEEAAGNKEDYQALSFLIDTCSISYAYSASLWLEAKRGERYPTKSDFIAFAPIFPEGVPGQSRAANLLANNNTSIDSTRASNSALPMTRDEVLSIKNIFDQKAGFMARWFGGLFNNYSQVYLEKDASEQRLKSENLHDYRYVHLATHGFANRAAPDLSGLAFADDSTSSQEDGVLYLGEIYNLSLNADLVALSACETGAGKLSRGEGLLGLSRGFLYAGARNLLVSLWKVNDASTARLMQEFYGNLLEGQSKAEALRNAKLHLIRGHDSNSKFARPYHWAPFVLIGE